ncbi:glycoside hydrolase [Linderina pennispora]|uniref:Glycoside hydrolase n=1 Tax=Linderina pennispora TaxID=61395 RepID=A0A1Y1WDB1_9FUNG|nr:glycoside hydrolase [Linderina pennispora]ORX71530.1 glycoside hydrolase [Linderina pennispora]
MQFKTLITAAGLALSMSVGGWTGSNLFSTILKNTATRTAFLNNMVSFVQTNNLDGVDIDWEYPGREGNTCNAYDPANDSKNISSPSCKTCVPSWTRTAMPFDGPNGPMKDVSAFAKVTDYINLMQYDINGNWDSTTGPNAPLQYAPGKGEQVSSESAIDAWSAAGWPTSKMDAGVPFYGRSLTATANMLNNPSKMYAQFLPTVPKGDNHDIPWADTCAGGPAIYSVAPWVRTWDNTTSTPWLFNPSTSIFISYDDPQSLKAKVDYAAAKGLAGTMLWSMEMDYNNELLDVLNSFPSGGSTTTATTPGTSSTATQPGTTSATKSATTGVPPVTSSTSSAPATSSSTNTGGPVAGGPCSTGGAYQCADTTGKNPAYFICNSGAWLAQSCGSGTACFQSGLSIYCNWPSA